MNKIILICSFSLLVLILVGIILGIYIYKNSYGEIKATENFTDQISKQIITASGASKPPDNIVRQLTIINNNKLSDETRNIALMNLAFYYSSEYSYTHNPEYREFTVNVLGKFAKEHFPKYYNASAFDIPCADPKCGQKLSNEIKKVLNLIESSTIPERYKNTITGNLTTAGYMPDNNLGEKKDGFTLVILQLTELDNPQASLAAQTLRSYANDKYKFDL